MKKIFLRIISTVIAGLFLSTQSPIICAEISNVFSDSSHSDSVSISEILGEVKEKRSEFTKHFRMSDGTMKAITYSDPVHYKEGEEFKEIDNTLIEGENDTYENTDSPFKIRFSKNFKNKGLIKINSEDHEISFSYIKKKYKEFDTEVSKDIHKKLEVRNSEDASSDKNNLEVKEQEIISVPITPMKAKALSESSVNSIPEIESEAKAVQIENLKIRQLRTRNKNEEKSSISKICSKAKYENSDEDIDLEYTVSGLELKENIILRKKLADNDRFDFELKTDLNVIKDDKGNLILSNSDRKTIFIMPKGNMWDSNENYSNEIDYEITPISEGYIISLIPNRDWFESAERVYPIKINSSIPKCITTGITDIQYSNLNPDTNYESVNHLSVGCLSEDDKWYTCLKCENLPKFSHGEIITKSELNLMPFPGSDNFSSGPNAYSVSPNNYIGIRNITDNWNNNVCWNNKPNSEEICQDYQATSNSTINNWNSWDITKSTKQWYTLDNPNDNNGLELYSLDESLSSVIRYVSTRSTEYPDYKPKLEISYKEFVGEESYWSYTNHEAGYNGRGIVNNYTGTLSVSENILSYSGSRNPVSIENTYNNVNYKENANSYFHTKTFTGGYPRSSYTGLGFRLSFDRLVYPLATYDCLYDQGFRYVYVDGDGTQHYFKLDGEDIIDEDGLNLTLTKENNGKIEIKDLGGNKITFFKPDANDEAYVLESDSDNNGNTTTYNYSEDYKITSITDAAGRTTNIEYINGTRTVSKITAADEKKVTFSYTDNKLTKVVYPDDMITEYKYDLHGRLSVVSTNEGSGRSVKYEYASNDKDSSNFFKVRSVAMYGSYNADPKTKGKSTEFWYEMNQTKITSKINNLDVPYHESTEVWQFDDYGRATNVMDENGNFYETEYFKKDEENLRTKHRIKETSSGQKIVHNLLKNSRADTGDLSNWDTENWSPDHVSSGNCCEITASSDQANLGNNSFKVSIYENHKSWPVAKQIVSIPVSSQDRKYTFSADVKINGTLNGGDGASLHIGAFKDNVQTAGDEYSQWICSTNDDWRKLSVTINVPAGSNYIRCYFGIKNSFGSAHFDCLQLEEGNTANEYNMVECSDFKENTGAWKGSNLDNSKDIITKNGMRISGNVALSKNISQKVIVNKKNPTFNVAIKVQAKSLPKTDIVSSITEKPGLFALLEIKYVGEETPRKVDEYFNQSIYDDQYYFNSISSQEYNTSDLKQADKTVEYIQIYVCYNFNCNEAYIKESQITIEDSLNSYHYNEKGNPKVIKDKFGNKTEMEYTASEEVKKITRNTGENETEAVENTYSENDNGHNLESQIREFAKDKKLKSTFTYDNAGNALTSNLSSADVAGKVVHFENTYQNNQNYLHTSKNSRNKVVTYNFNENNGNLESIVNSNGVEINYCYDDADRMTKETCGKLQNQYSYLNGMLSEISNKVFYKAKTTYKFIRNIFGNVTETQVGNRTLSKIIYDAGDGLLRQVKYGNEQTINYDYDEKGRLIKKSFGYEKGNKFGEITYAYDNKDRITQTYDSVNNLTANFEYDRFGRFVRMYRSDNNSSDVSYDKFRNIVNKSVLRLFEKSQIIENTFGKSNLILNSRIQTENSSILSKYNFGEIARLDSTEAVTDNEATGIKHNFLYEDYGDSRTTGLISALEIYKKASGQWTDLIEKFKYTYDNVGNITDIKDINENLIAHYEYDKLNQLVRENNSQINKTITYTYNEGGNLTKKTIYSYTTDSDLSQIEEENIIVYIYKDKNWPDKLSFFNGQNIIYDTIGNPLEYKEWKFEWSRGHKLDKAKNSEYDISYKYDGNGIRTQKVVNNVATEFITSGIKVLAQKTGDNTLIWQIDGNGNTVGFTYNGTQYLYLKNAQNDIIGIADIYGNIIAKYTYDSWGKLISMTDEAGADKTSDTNFIGYINPLRYREYYYDNETGLYYLNARYYDPEIGRFINADEILESGLNTFVYCQNAPISSADYTGEDCIVLLSDFIGVGHGGLLFQDGKDKWYHHHWGPQIDSTRSLLTKRIGSKSRSNELVEMSDFKIDDSMKLRENEGSLLKAINTFINSERTYTNIINNETKQGAIYGKEYKKCLYIKGDSSKVYEYITTQLNSKYNLLTNNCMQVTLSLLSQSELTSKFRQTINALLGKNWSIHHPFAFKSLIPKRAFAKMAKALT